MVGSRGLEIRVRGLVQGVGFRPFVWRIAHEEKLPGEVLNDAEGVLIRIWGRPPEIEHFICRLKNEYPPLARIDSIETRSLKGVLPACPDAFSIVESVEGAVSTGIVPDAATCAECQGDVKNPLDRRSGYAFTNCTHCGPRLSIIKSIPYDRAKTSMADFKMCPSCLAEYENPADRRFHAQPNACPICGPKLWVEDRDGPVVSDDPLDLTARLLLEGQIVAIKGIGGFHLAVDAMNSKAVDLLRMRKRRPDKPLALMVKDLEQARTYCEIGEGEETVLRDRSAPIVLARMKHDCTLPKALAPEQDQLGIMLPYTPMHHLLMGRLAGPIVLTSGNLSEEPQVIDNDKARQKLGTLADGFLMHDRDIINRLDDSVVRDTRFGPMYLRRARGIAPAPLALAKGFSQSQNILALGGELKATFCMLRNGQAVLSQHIGDLENALALEDLQKNLSLYQDTLQFTPDVIAIDAHPDYLSSQLGERLAKENGIPFVRVQHHHAHLASVLADNGIEPENDCTIGVILDGTGFGADGSIWGGEILVGGYHDFERVRSFDPVPLPGGSVAVKEPWRNLVAHLHRAFGTGFAGELAGTELEERLAGKTLPVLLQMIEKGVNSPLSSSAGRLFDAVAALLGVCFERQTYEGQSGASLEALAAPYMTKAQAYSLVEGEAALAWKGLWRGILTDLRSGEARGFISARFHQTLIKRLSDVVRAVAREKGIGKVALSGGVMQNRHLFEGLVFQLQGQGLEVLWNRQVPSNDGGLSLGQAVIAAVHSKRL